MRHLAAPAADILNWSGLGDNMRQVYVLCLIGAACGIAYCFIKGKVGMAVAIIVICLLSLIPMGIASEGAAGVGKVGSNLYHAVVG